MMLTKMIIERWMLVRDSPSESSGRTRQTRLAPINAQLSHGRKLVIVGRQWRHGHAHSLTSPVLSAQSEIVEHWSTTWSIFVQNNRFCFTVLHVCFHCNGVILFLLQSVFLILVVVLFHSKWWCMSRISIRVWMILNFSSIENTFVSLQVMAWL